MTLLTIQTLTVQMTDDELDVDMFGQDSFIEQEDDFEEEGFSIEVSPVNESESDLEVDTDSFDLMTITEQEFLASDKTYYSKATR